MINNKQILIITVLLGYLISLSGQGITGLPKRPYERLGNMEPAPAWYHTFIDNENISNIRDGYNVLAADASSYINQPASFIYNGFLYAFHMININDIRGMYFVKTELSSGQIEWAQRFGYPDSDIQELSLIAYINGSQVIVAGVRRVVPYSVFLFPLGIADRNVRFFERIYDDQTGTLISHNYPADSNEEPGAVLEFTGVTSHRLAFIQPIDSGRYKYLQSNRVGDQPYIYINDLDNKGRNISAYDSIATPGRSHFMTKVLPVGSDNLAIVASYTIDNITSCHLWLYDYIKNNFSSKQLEIPLDEGERIYTNNISGTKFILGNYPISGAKPKSRKLWVCHSDGTISHFANLMHHDTLQYDGLYADYDHIGNRLIVAASRLETYFTNIILYFDIYIVEANGTSSLVYTIKSSNQQRAPFICKILISTENDLYINFVERGFFYDINKNSVQSDYNAVAVSWMKFSGEDVGLMSSLPTVTNASNCLSVYPNPASDRIDVDFHAPVTGKVVVYDVLGNAHCSLGISDVSYTSIDISGWAAGVYFIQFEDKRGEKFNQTQKFIKVK
jgi:hypothetical protein